MFAWIASGWRDLTANERLAIERSNGDLVVSAISFWELRLKWQSNPRRSAEERLVPPELALPLATAHKIDVAPFTAEAATTSLVPPLGHKDPFDEALLVHAGLLGARLLTRDQGILGHPLAYPS